MVCARWALRQAVVAVWLHAALLLPDQPEPCSTSPLCSCRQTHMSCVAVPLHRFPEWPKLELHHLDISLSNLEVLTESALDGLRLQTLVLVANKLSLMESHSLSSMALTLASLDLGFNEFTEIPQEGLRDLKVLNWLNLQNNQIANIDVDTKWHYMEETLTSISLANNQITQLAPKAFASLHRLLQINLEGNHLRSVAINSLPPSLTLLKLSSNFLHSFTCALLHNLPRVQAIYLRHNVITFEDFINSTCLMNKTKKLEKIDLSNNNLGNTSEISILREVQVRQIILDLNGLTYIPELVFVNNKVEKLSLSYNKLDTINGAVFSSLKNSLEHLELDHNKLTHLPDTLNKAIRLRHLSIAYNELVEAPFLPPRLQTLSLAGNFLTAIPKGLQLLNTPSILYLDLSYNRISFLMPNDFQNWTSALSTINLKGNRIAQINVNIFSENMSIKEINLSFNDLYYIHPQSFSNISTSLQVIESSSNLFSGIFPFEIDNELENIRWLSFDNNDFYSLRISQFAYFRNLKYINLDYNRIIEILNDDVFFNVSIKISNLRIAYNFIDTVNRKTFANLLDLENLDLSFNRINNLTMHSFRNLPSLRYLSLSGNIISFIESEAFANLPKLELLEIQGNNISKFSLDSLQNISGFDRTFTLNISNNIISQLNGEGTVSINIFDVSHNKLSEVPIRFFSSIESSVRQIILSHNIIYHIQSEAFGDSIYLEILDLHKNNISNIKMKSFHQLFSLQILDISFNVISQLSAEQFCNLDKLRYLKLNNNYLKLLPRDVFKNTIIEHLDLSNNNLYLFPATALSQIGFTLRYLDLSYNFIQYLDNNIFRSTPYLNDLNIGNNLLTLISDNTFSSIISLRKLDISFNVIKANFKELFHNLLNLKHLNLANITLKSVPYLPLANLTSLNLSSNEIVTIKDTDVKRLINLRQLDISFNHLTSFVPKVWFYLNNLYKLDISYNPIVKITQNSFKWLKSLSHLNLNGFEYLKIIEKDSFRPLVSLRSLQIQSLSTINHSKFLLANITSSIPSLHNLIIHWTESNLRNQLHGINSTNIRYLELKGEPLREISDDAFESFVDNHELFIRITSTSLTNLPNNFMKHLGRIPQLGLDLSHNKLNTISPAIFYPNFTSWSQVATKLLSGGLILAGNPLRCECELAWLGSWLRRWMQENEVSAELRRSVSASFCIDQHGRRLPLLQLRADEAECYASALSSDAPSRYNIVLISYCILLMALLRL